MKEKSLKETAARLCWGFCNLAAAGSEDPSFPQLMRSLFGGFTAVWFWLALIFEGRAYDRWLEAQAERRGYRITRRPELVAA